MTSAEARAFGRSALQQGGFAQAEPVFREILQAEPNDAEALSFLAAACLGQGKIDEAVAHFKSALRFRPDNAYAQLEVAIFLIRQGHAAEAIPYLDEAARLDPHLKERAIFQEAERAAAWPVPPR